MKSKTDMLARKVVELTIDIQSKTAELRELYAKRRAAVAKIQDLRQLKLFVAHNGGKRK